MKSKSGFTIVELLIVIVVIAILAAISIVAYNGIQSRARDAERKSDISAIQKHIEIFYINNGFYPGVGQLQSLADQGHADWVKNNLQGLSNESIRAPGAPSSDLDSIVGEVTATKDRYGYRPTHGNGAVCGTGSTGNPCVSYVLSYKKESSDQAVVQLSSLN
jgi:prepilin-type N-terminal cleavage/methylation domain-containing protein